MATGEDSKEMNHVGPGPPENKKLTERLSDEELLDLIPTLENGDFYPIGLKLDYDNDTLNQIRGDHPDDISAAFKALFLSWENYVTVSPKAARLMLAEALKFVERKDLAGRVIGEQPKDEKERVEYMCNKHNFREASYYCKKSKEKICERCLEEYETANIVPVNDMHIEIKHKLKSSFDRLNQARDRLERIREQGKGGMTGMITKTQVGIQVMREGIYKVFSEAHDMMSKERDALIEKANVLERSASPEVYGFALSKLKKCELALMEVKEKAQYVNDVTKFESASQKIDVILNACLDRGPLMNLNKLEMKMVACPSVYLGHLEEVSGWEFVEQFDLPEDKKEEMNVCIKLTDRKIVVGYRLGGADIIDLDTKKTSRIAYDVRISSMALMSSGHIILCTTDNKLGMITQAGHKMSSFFFTQKTNKPCCVSVDDKDTIYMGYSEFSNIEVFETTGGFLRNIATVLQPWCMSIMKSGHIAVTECTIGLRDAVEIMSQEGRPVGHIIGRLGCSPFSCIDEAGNIFVAMVTNDGRCTLRKYSPTGDHLETVVEELQLEWHEHREWLQLASLSPNELVLCDRGSVYVYRRRPTLSMMTTIIGSD
ncbi:uncharacterized protein LOC121426765 [Lytechinus variegatus]|uniref:uncharacterized protein LOC121426765 n=1 Tax=Lytechinus variegatus TaxID=7654 RepID=UPI001BB12729|nr:uncharacterized protein LOC121426765 [Lytechinus variegatus]